ncbi:response regulator receiver sensor signal transduction histidine kinase [Fulvivirga imtechensis AK7]|uniref:histidine kinase n=2 Tax=Fulvivirga TaxID=396811 RepID=L8JYQ8_9BACT|nr:response regulator receiver sensor signal transduction histidine kinase [Fulvivirga imtechensis AK7]
MEMVSNLVSNSIKFSPANQAVSLGIQKSADKHLKIVVSDHGPGISKEDQKVMYNKYQRASATPTAGEKSTGLGLAIVKRYAEALGYTLHCESAPGEGTTFIIEIPDDRN